MIEPVLRRLDAIAPEVLALLARVVFAAVLFGYFWTSALTKLGPEPGTLALGAFAQIFPRALESVGYDVSQLGLWHSLVVAGGTAAEFVLPVMIVLGLMARLAALGMIGFVGVQSLTDIVGHGAGPETIGLWFDRFPDALISDQRALWVAVLLVTVFHGAGSLSADNALRHLRRNRPQPA